MNSLTSLYDWAVEETRLLGFWIAQSGLRAGEYKLHADGADFGRWLLCDGRALSCEEYAELYDVLGSAFGADAAGGTFSLPDFRGRAIAQPGAGAGLTARALGDAVGTEAHLLTAAEMPQHTHSGTTGLEGSHDHDASSASNGSHSHTVTDPGHTHTITTINDDFNNSGGAGPSFAADSAGLRTWPNNITRETTGIVVNTEGLHSHVITIQPAGDHTHDFVTAPAGLGNAHPNMQPTLFGANVFIFAGPSAPFKRINSSTP